LHDTRVLLICQAKSDAATRGCVAIQVLTNRKKQQQYQKYNSYKLITLKNCFMGCSISRTSRNTQSFGGGGIRLIIIEENSGKAWFCRVAVIFLLAGSFALQGCDIGTDTSNNESNGSNQSNGTNGSDANNGGNQNNDSNGSNGNNQNNDNNTLTGDTSPAAAVARFQNYLSREDFEYLFPNRFGSPVWQEQTANAGREPVDYYSYANLLEAIRRMANINIRIEYRFGVPLNPYTMRTIAINKTTGAETTVIEGGGFNSQWNMDRPINVQRVVDYGSFLAAGSANDRRRELAAFLANIGHETTGGWPTAHSGGQFAWGLHFNEEVAFVGGYTSNYTDHANVNFPPVPGRSYHGRGPIQLSWNFNYGQMSAFLFGDKNYLLENPQRVVECGILGWQTAIWFWMTPQAPRPSCHDVMVGNWSNWTPSARDRATNQTRAGFGHTIMVINGGLEGNNTDADGRVFSRIGFYRRIAEKLGADITGEKLDTEGMHGQTWFN